MDYCYSIVKCFVNIELERHQNKLRKAFKISPQILNCIENFYLFVCKNFLSLFSIMQVILRLYFTFREINKNERKRVKFYKQTTNSITVKCFSTDKLFKIKYSVS